MSFFTRLAFVPFSLVLSPHLFVLLLLGYIVADSILRARFVKSLLAVS
jgi:hypothetical protein